MSLAGDVIARVKTLNRRRDPWLSLWQDCAEVFLPERANFLFDRQEGQMDTEIIYDATPRLAARDLASALDGLMKDKSSDWFQIVPEDDSLIAYDDVQTWLEQVRDTMWRSIYNPHARFIKSSTECDNALVVFGWSALWVLENSTRNGLMFKCTHNRDIMFDESADGTVDTVALKEVLTPRQAAQRFGFENLAEPIQKALREENTKQNSPRFVFIQLVSPRDDYDPGRIGATGLAYKSCVIDEKHEKVMNEGGFNEFPVAVPRWDTVPGQVYARSPAMLALPDSLTLQAIGKTLLLGGERAADPPLMVPSDAFLSPIRTFPGGISTFDVQALADGLSSPVFPLPTSNQLPVGREMQGDYRGQVQMAFYANVLKLPIDKIEMTATEILERKQEFIRALGPVFGRLETDYIGKIVERVFGIMDRAGAFPQRPDELMGEKITFRFQSPIQQARKAIEIGGFSQALQVLTPLGQVQPQIFDNIDGDQIMRDAPEWSGMRTKWLRTKDEVDQLRQEREQSQAATQVAGAAQPVADSIKSIAQAEQISNSTIPQTQPQ